MDRFKEKFSVLPIEVMVVLAINVVVAAFWLLCGHGVGAIHSLAVSFDTRRTTINWAFPV